MLTSRVHTVIVEEQRNADAVDYITTCTCGWESLPHITRHDAICQRCPVMEAELEGAKRRAKRRSLPLA